MNELARLLRLVRRDGVVKGFRFWWTSGRQLRAFARAYEPQRLATEARIKYVATERAKFMEKHQISVAGGGAGPDVAVCTCGWAGHEWSLTVHLLDAERDFRATLVRAA